MCRLAADNGIRGILQKHDWSVGVLKELSPTEHTILGYNRNRGMEIALRLRTDSTSSGLRRAVVSLARGALNNVLLGRTTHRAGPRAADFKGFRHYHMIKSVLLHELAHMVHSEHNNNFHMLNRQLEKEAVQLDWTKSAGHRVGGAEVNPDDPPPADDSDGSGDGGGGAYTLGMGLRRLPGPPPQRPD